MEIKLIFLEHLLKANIYSVSILSKNSPYGGVYDYEFSDFLRRMALDRKDERQAKEIKKFIKKIGTDGVLDDFLVREGGASSRLPPYYFTFWDSKSEDDFGLRLYCVKVDDSNLILLNGGRKTTRNPRKCVNCKEHFLFAEAFSNAFFDAVLKDDIEIDKEILTEDNFTLTI